MTLAPHLILVVPGFISKTGSSRPAPTLEKLLARAVTERSSQQESDARLVSWQRGVLNACGLGGRAHELASAPLARYGQTGLSEPGWWMHATPVHLRAGLDDMVLQPIVDLPPTERSGLESCVKACLVDLGAFLVPSADGGWLLHTPHALALSLPPPLDLVGRSLRGVLRGTAGEPHLLRTLTELQMSLHEHPVNRDRERRGAMPANAIWLWGGGKLGAAPQVRSCSGFRVAHEYLIGLARWLGAETMGISNAADALALAVERIVVEAHALDPDRLDEEWIAPLAHALARGRCSRLTLVLDDWRLELDARCLRRFWRGRRPLTELGA